MDNVMWAMALLELGTLALIVGVVVWAIRKKGGNATKPDNKSDPEQH